MIDFNSWLTKRECGGAFIVGDFPKSKLQKYGFNIAGAAGLASVTPKDSPPLHWVKKRKKR